MSDTSRHHMFDLCPAGHPSTLYRPTIPTPLRGGLMLYAVVVICISLVIVPFIIVIDDNCNTRGDNLPLSSMVVVVTFVANCTQIDRVKLFDTKSCGNLYPSHHSPIHHTECQIHIVLDPRSKIHNFYTKLLYFSKHIFY
jgi:hypothetical protein